MKHICLFLFLLFGGAVLKAENKEDFTDTVTINVQYLCEEANEVFLAWGINGWFNINEDLWPEGTYKKENVLYTPMKKNGALYTVTFKVKPNTLLDYAFWITKGPRNVPSDIWDTNIEPQKDY